MNKTRKICKKRKNKVGSIVNPTKKATGKPVASGLSVRISIALQRDPSVNSARMASETSETRITRQPWSATLLRAGIITVV